MSVKSKEKIEKIKRKIFFNPMIRWLYLSSLKLYFSAILSFKGEVNLVSILILTTITLVAIILAGILNKNAENLDSETCIGMYGAAYDGKTLAEGRNRFICI